VDSNLGKFEQDIVIRVEVEGLVRKIVVLQTIHPACCEMSGDSVEQKVDCKDSFQVREIHLGFARESIGTAVGELEWALTVGARHREIHNQNGETLQLNNTFEGVHSFFQGWQNVQRLQETALVWDDRFQVFSDIENLEENGQVLVSKFLL
jgi:hypothetical protein